MPDGSRRRRELLPGVRGAGRVRCLIGVVGGAIGGWTAGDSLR